MLKKLKIKFIFVIMTIVTILFAMIFGFVMHFTKLNIERESIQMMRAMAFQPIRYAPVSVPDGALDEMRFPFFTITIDENGELDAFGGDYYDLTNEEFLNDLVNSVSGESEDVGIIGKYNLRYCKVISDDSNSIVFTDISNENAMLKVLIRNCIMIGLIGFVIFFIISLILAQWVVKPIEKTWNEQKQFIADASHELKTPLTVIMTNAEMLQDKGYNEADRIGFTKNILSMSKRMRGLVESLLELARMDSGNTVIVHDTIDFSKIVSDSILPFEPLFFEKNIEIVSEIEYNIQVNGDRSKLGQVVNILLDNALKYSDTDFPVKVVLKHHGTHCILSVSGKGEPISKTDRKNIFKRFYRIDKARTDGQSYGLGLSIAESIVSGHGGNIWVKSEDGYNTFYVSLTDSIPNLV